MRKMLAVCLMLFVASAPAMACAAPAPIDPGRSVASMDYNTQLNAASALPARNSAATVLVVIRRDIDDMNAISPAWSALLDRPPAGSVTNAAPGAAYVESSAIGTLGPIAAAGPG